MYIEIQQLKALGLKKAQIARKLGISRPTVYEYFDMSADEYDKRLEAIRQRRKKPDQYHTLKSMRSWPVTRSLPVRGSFLRTMITPGRNQKRFQAS